MPIPSSMADLSTTAASNSPASNESVGPDLDNYMRAYQAIMKQHASKGADIASASTITIPNAGSYFVVTGTTTISAINNSWDGRFVILKFSGAVQLTHSSGLICPGGANITTVAGEVVSLANESSGVWRVIHRLLPAVHDAASKTALVDADEFQLSDSADSFNLKKVTWANIKATLNLSASHPVRQTVISGPVDSSGYSAFGGSTGSTTVTASGTLKATAAAGDVNYTGSITNPSWTGLSTNGTMYLYLDVTSAGVVTAGSTTLVPVYRWGGTDVTTNGQFTFNIQEMVGKVGNGSSATQVYRVFVGEVTVSGGAVTAIVWYALMGRYVSPDTASPSSGSSLSFNHNLGTTPRDFDMLAVCQSATGGYAVGDVTKFLNSRGTGSYEQFQNPVGANRLSIFAKSFSSGGWNVIQQSDGTSQNISGSASWKIRAVANRGW